MATLLEGLIPKVVVYVEDYMGKFDGSHDFNHIKRVVGLSHTLYGSIVKATPDSKLDINIITLSALLHDVGDRKYLKPGEDSNTLVRNLLISFGAPEHLAARIQTICAGVSYTSEMKDPAYVLGLIEFYPELAVVQDADRLDAIGAVGIGRLFTYGGARTSLDMQGSIAHFDKKLLLLETMMKTEPGLLLAKERTEILKQFAYDWEHEIAVQRVADDVLDGFAASKRP
ncbi:HD domain-containing protein [Calycina marina]|uniref:HD domain-containing protein n=1 Tax=Calycina marina TaxID=1763456 RepID=A0A9P7YYK0_9HELO|nr:HD domain-containing protein [Calycina marina]